ncbi:MAG: GMP synthase-like glutamine amidotransferase [Motiliproteus sp.]|jgi:GMP synthase-like glutamine amidotransferase
MRMKIGILATGITPDDLLDDFGTYAGMVTELFTAVGCEYRFETFDVRDGEFPASAQDCDGWVITGSKCNVYQQLDWMLRLKTLIVEIYQAQKPMLGICFGHQIIAEAFGGRVDKYPGGWGVGLHRYQLVGENPLFTPVDQGFTLNAMHQDQVLDKPDNAEVVAESEFCRYAALRYDNRILTLQAHPEFSLAFEYTLVQSRKGSVVPEASADQGLASLRGPVAATDALAVARWMAAFLEQPRP